MRRLIAALMTFFLLSLLTPSVETDSRAIQVETLLQATTAWDGSSYGAYPAGKPQITVLRITIPARATLNWHTHPMPNVGYILAGELTIEKQDGSGKKHFTAGQALPETINTMHRGIAGDKPVELVVFYAGTTGMPVSKDRVEAALPGSTKPTSDRTAARAPISSASASADVHVGGACPSNIGGSAP